MWTTVSSNAADKPVVFSTQHGTKISHDTLVNQNIPEAHDGYWYWTKPGVYGGDLQTVMASRPDEHVYTIYYGRRLFKLLDGAEVSIDYALDPPDSKSQWADDVKYAPKDNLPRYPPRTRYLRPDEVAKRDDPSSTRPLVISLHGLTGGSHESYVRATISELVKPEIGFECAVITTRGCNRTRLTTPQLFNAAWTDDIRQFVRYIKAKQPERPIYLVGYSLGASILANYLGQEGENSVIDGAAIVACPWDLFRSGAALETSVVGKYIYNPIMTGNLNRLATNNAEMMLTDPHFKAQWDLKKGAKAKTLYEFDDTFTAPLFGFTTASEYYRTASSLHRLPRIRTPSLILESSDDPVVGHDHHFQQDIRNNPYMHHVYTDVGGHLGWFAAGGTRWFPGVIAKYFRALYDTVDRSKPVQDSVIHEQKWFVDDRFVTKASGPPFGVTRANSTNAANGTK